MNEFAKIPPQTKKDFIQSELAATCVMILKYISDGRIKKCLEYIWGLTMNHSVRMHLLLFMLCTQLMLAGCSSNGRSSVSRENYNRLKMGMSYEEVITILGAGNTCDNAVGDRSCIWGDEKKNIGVQFVGGKVVFLTSTGL